MDCVQCGKPLGEQVAESGAGLVCEPCAIAMGMGYRLEANPHNPQWKRVLGGLLWFAGLGTAFGVATGAIRFGKRSKRRASPSSRRTRKSAKR